MIDQKLSFRRDLQGLRAIAILLVVLTHAHLGIVPGGFIGVDVFFVLSGYLITALLLHELQQTGRIAFMRFYARRLKRLLPALVFMLSVSFGIAVWLLSGVEARAQLLSSPFAVTWTSNLYFAFATIDYFNELASQDLFLHTWSLGVEEQFYLIWPVVLLMLFWAGKLWRGANRHRLGLMLSGLGIVFIASLALSLYWTVNLPQEAFYLMPSRIWQFSTGAIVYLSLRGYSLDRHELTQGFNKTVTYFTLVTGLILIIGSAMVLNRGLAYPGLWALAPSLGAASIIVAGHMISIGQTGPLAHPVLVWLGDRSYSLYLWHWPVFIFGFSLGLQDHVIPTLGMMALSLLAATLSFRYIELPFWKGRWSHARPFRIIWVSFFIMVTMMLAAYQGIRQLPRLDNRDDISNQWRRDTPDIYDAQCDAWYSHALFEPCVLGDASASRTVVLLGDSIGAQWFSMIPEIFREPYWRIVLLTKSSCAMVDEDYFLPIIGKTYQVCTDWRNTVLDKLDLLKPDVLIIGSSTTYPFSEHQWIEGSSRILDRVSQAATTVIVIPGTPSLSFDGPGCVYRHLSADGQIDNEACLAKGRLKRIKAKIKFLEQAVNRFSNVHMLNLNDLICPDGQCRATNTEGLVVFRDSQHLTDTFVRAQIPYVRERLERLFNDPELLNQGSITQ